MMIVSDLFTREEAQQIVTNSIRGMGQASEAELQQILDWCLLQKVGYYTMQSLLKGDVLIREIKDNEPVFVLNNDNIKPENKPMLTLVKTEKE